MSDDRPGPCSVQQSRSRPLTRRQGAPGGASGPDSSNTCAPRTRRPSRRLGALRGPEPANWTLGAYVRSEYRSPWLPVIPVVVSQSPPERPESLSEGCGRVPVPGVGDRRQTSAEDAGGAGIAGYGRFGPAARPSPAPETRFSRWVARRGRFMVHLARLSRAPRHGALRRRPTKDCTRSSRTDRLSTGQVPRARSVCVRLRRDDNKPTVTDP